MNNKRIARASITINASVDKVWEALVNPEMIKQYMFGTHVISEWKEGSEIIWKGIWEGKAYEDKGRILKLRPKQILQYSHYSPVSGLADTPENYHNVLVKLSGDNGTVMVSLEQDNNPTEEAREHSETNWKMMLKTLKAFLEEQKSI